MTDKKAADSDSYDYSEIISGTQSASGIPL